MLHNWSHNVFIHFHIILVPSNFVSSSMFHDGTSSRSSIKYISWAHFFCSHITTNGNKVKWHVQSKIVASLITVTVIKTDFYWIVHESLSVWKDEEFLDSYCTCINNMSHMAVHWRQKVHKYTLITHMSSYEWSSKLDNYPLLYFPRRAFFGHFRQLICFSLPFGKFGRRQ